MEFSGNQRILASLTSEPWLIQRNYLDTIVSIAQRLNDVPESLLSQLKEKQQANEAVLSRIGRPLVGTHRVILRDNAAIVPVRGPIFRYANLFTEISGATSIQVLATDLQQAIESPSVTRIILDIDSPGGQVTGTSEFAEQVRNSGKPIDAYVSGTGASAAYWIASAADRVIARDTAILGSIGVVSRVFRDEDNGSIKFISSQSPRKHADPASDSGRDSYQAMVDSLAQVFIQTVATYRGVDTETVLARYGQGALLVGQQAVNAGMADALGSLESLVAGISSKSSNYRKVSQARMIDSAQQADANDEVDKLNDWRWLAAECKREVKQAKERGYPLSYAAAADRVVKSLSSKD
ncbi:ClpP class serine protease [Methylohalomonas lacus]|uniref:ClpP class serine protease n=1 Tax=Methylohalomonas lacus TaxID=398773 RepID=A0AAE3HI58_9GAMM|nr:S49 family peptidase [Methylohalomonas lacus]MCS3902796.1 ClpP class serine protease [Methylohalomonas lacus]